MSTLPFDVKVTLKIEETATTSSVVEFHLEEVKPGKFVLDPKFDDAAIYTMFKVGASYAKGSGQECLYVYGREGTNVLPTIDSSNYGYVAVCMKGARSSDGPVLGVDVRGLITAFLDSLSDPKGKPSGPGTTHSYP